MLLPGRGREPQEASFRFYCTTPVHHAHAYKPWLADIHLVVFAYPSVILVAPCRHIGPIWRKHHTFLNHLPVGQTGDPLSIPRQRRSCSGDVQFREQTAMQWWWTATHTVSHAPRRPSSGANFQLSRNFRERVPKRAGRRSRADVKEISVNGLSGFAARNFSLHLLRTMLTSKWL